MLHGTEPASLAEAKAKAQKASHSCQAPSLGSDVTNRAEAGCDSLSFTWRWRGSFSQHRFLKRSITQTILRWQCENPALPPKGGMQREQRRAWCHPWSIQDGEEDTQRPHWITAQPCRTSHTHTLKSCQWARLKLPSSPESCLPTPFHSPVGKNLVVCWLSPLLSLHSSFIGSL